MKDSNENRCNMLILMEYLTAFIIVSFCKELFSSGGSLEFFIFGFLGQDLSTKVCLQPIL